MIILKKLEIFPSVLIPEADMLQGRLIRIPMANLWLHMPLIQPGAVFGFDHSSALWWSLPHKSVSLESEAV